jgi:predicted peroxiredoxin
MVCSPCAAVRNYKEEDLIPEVIITGSGAMQELIKQGAVTLCF